MCRSKKTLHSNMILTFFLCKLIKKRSTKLCPCWPCFPGSFFRWPWSLEPQMLVDGWGWTHFPGSKLDAKCQISSIEGRGGDHCCLGWGVVAIVLQGGIVWAVNIRFDPLEVLLILLGIAHLKDWLVFFREVARKKKQVVCWPISTLFKIFGGFLMLRHPDVLKIQRW